MARRLEMLLWRPSLALIDVLDRSGEASVDGHAVVRSDGVLGGTSIIRPILV